MAFPRPVGGRSLRSPWQGGRLISFPLVQLLPFTAPYGERTAAHPAPISIKAAARVGRTAFWFLPALPGGAGACFSKGLLLPAGPYA